MLFRVVVVFFLLCDEIEIHGCAVLGESHPQCLFLLRQRIAVVEGVRYNVVVVALLLVLQLDGIFVQVIR